jgi:hypothetical protein
MAILLGFLGLYNTTIISYKFRMKKNLGEKMIKLTDKENKLVQVLLDNNDDTDCHCISVTIL